MKSINFTLKEVMLFLLFIGITVIAKAQSTVVAGTMSVKYSVTDLKYHVYFTPTSSGSGSIGNGSSISITAPAGNTLTFTNFTSVTSNWVQGGINKVGGGTPGTGSSSLSYWNFYTNTDYGVNFVAGTPVELFNFSSAGSCNGSSLNINTSTDTQIESAQYGSVILDLSGSVNQAGDLTLTNVDSPNSAFCVPPSPSMSCTTNTLSPNVFTLGTPSTSTYTIALSNITPGVYRFAQTSAGNFTTVPELYNITLVANQTSVQIPIKYDGGGAVGSQNLTLIMIDPNVNETTASCTQTATINAAAVVSVSNPTIPKTVSTNSGQQTGTASTEMNPSGATSYIYSIIACSPTPAGTTALPASSNLIMTNPNNGVYSYTTPTTAGTYSYCIKVCDANNSNNCATTTYTLNVSAVCNAGSVAPSVR
ncbi:hypothetical protein Emtol_3013 [Emticicia oligotrophica DSM 17448]|uniref:Uncharacterized protein n=1 Tax=Emticicia oligotrophica (strain DSM 17448 / CIP 109782 / MTCC 6937 / GPTSA100-15) TaxID=929562 RepID=A0ABN4APQ3_EMTOG|nr:hypothetical protein [Emticicia oligotrophica]AFK04146.1 hypothetical protein Emtol_3013 [Emticicia oligotrophica DSM 17448]